MYSGFDKPRSVFGFFEAYEANDQYAEVCRLHAAMAGFKKKYSDAYNRLNPDKPIKPEHVRLPVFVEDKDTKKLTVGGEFDVGKEVAWDDPGMDTYRAKWGWNQNKDLKLRYIEIGGDPLVPEQLKQQAKFYAQIWDQYEADPLAFFRSLPAMFVK
jgi:hypothetical protein